MQTISINSFLNLARRFRQVSLSVLSLQAQLPNLKEKDVVPMRPCGCDKRVLFLGFGAVARCTIPILMDHMKVDPRRVKILDFDPQEAALRPWLARGMAF